jgi:superfamily II DNA or RNA helicase
MSDSHFITNDGENSLSKIIKGIMPKTYALDFLVGYFYFSGIKEIKDHIEDKQIRILVGMELEQELHKKMSNMQIRETFYKNLVEKITRIEADYFEKEEKTFKLYWKKIKDGTLEIRQTRDPCHAKLYIFNYNEQIREGGEVPGAVITGSSNLTYNGLTGHSEINVRFDRKQEFKDACKIFESLWENAVIIASKDNIKDFEDGVIKKTWIENQPSPYLMYLRSLYEYFNIEDRAIRTARDIAGKDFQDFKYQEDAVRIALSTIEKHNGVIISDVVGLGKSIVASTIAGNLNLRTIIIAPPHLCTGENSWDYYRGKFSLNAKVFSRGKIEAALKHYNDYTKENEKWLIIIDEAHNYRNEYTEDYKMLHDLCMGNKVALITATPFNNAPQDIFSMLKLFQIPTKSTLQTVDNLKGEFSKLINEFKKLKKEQKNKSISPEKQDKKAREISEKIRNIINPLIIRRSRRDLKEIKNYRLDLERQKIEFPKMKDPILLNYNLGSLSELYLSTLNKISNKDGNCFKATRYNPVNYCKNECVADLKKDLEKAKIDFDFFKEGQMNLADFMRKLLVLRFESSQEAFRNSLNNMLDNCVNIKKWVEKRETVPIYKKGDLPVLDSDNPEFEIENQIENLKEKGLFEIKAEYLSDNFLKDLNSDIDLLSELKRKWKVVEQDKQDPKLDEFRKEINKQLKEDPNRKIIVFSQFADTIEYLEKKLDGLKLFAYTSKKATETNKSKIKENFDASAKSQKNDFQILLATDAISEGYNLNRAGTIFNYDIPYNPTRVIQRVGRINRINKKMFEELYIYNYFPTAIGERETRTKEISTLKMTMIHAIMGEDTKILTSEENLQNFFTKEYKRLFEENDEKSWDADYRSELNSVLKSAEMKEALNLPLRTRIQRRILKKNYGVLVFAKKGRDFVFKFADVSSELFGGEPNDISPQKGFELLKAMQDEKSFKVSDCFSEIYGRIKESLFKKSEEVGINDKSRRDAVDKINMIIHAKVCDKNYLEDLKQVVEIEAVSGADLRIINSLKQNEYKDLPNKISKDYIQRALSSINEQSKVQEFLILAQEIMGK